VKSITRDDMVAFYQKNCVANNVLVGAVGDVKAGDVKKALEKYFAPCSRVRRSDGVHRAAPLEKTKYFSTTVRAPSRRRSTSAIWA